MRTPLSPEGLMEGIAEHAKRKFDLRQLVDDEEAERAIGSSIRENIDQGFRSAMIVFPVYSPFFFLEVDQQERSDGEKKEIVGLREKFVQENGVENSVEFYLILRTEEVLVLFK
jgi:hypothetical protein